MTVGQVIAKLGVDPKEYEKGLRKAERQAEKAGSKIGSIFKQAFSVTLGMGMFEALKKGFKSTVGTAISFNSMLQTAQIGFATMLGSAEKAQKFLDDMADFAARTPFEYPELLEAAKRMLAYGFAAEEVLPTLRAVGDASAALGSGAVGIDRITLALGQIQAKGKLSAEEMRQLTEAGVPAWHILAEAMGKTVPELQDMVSKGLVPGAKAVDMLTAGMTKRFGGMMASMEDTWQGVTSSIKDIWRMTVGEMTSGLFSGINTWLQGVRDWLSGFYDTFKQFGLQTALLKYFGAEFATMANVAIWAAKTVFNAFGWVYGILRKNWGMVSVLATAFLTYVTATKAASLATSLFRTVSLLLSGNLSAQSGILGFLNNVIVYYKVQMLGATATTNIFTAVLYKLKAALYAVHTALGPIGWIILAITAIVAGGMALWNKYAQSVQKAWETSMAEKMKAQQEKLQDSMKGVTGATEDQTDALADAAKAASKNLQSFDEVHQLQEDMSDTAAGDMFAMPDAGLFDTDAFDMEGMFDFDFEGPKTSLSGFWEWIKQGAGNLWDSVKEKWGNFTGWVSSWGIWTTLKEKWGNFKEWAGNLWDGVKEKWGNFTGWVQEKWSGFKDKAGEIWTGIKTNVQTKWEELKTNAPVIWENIKTGIQTRWENLKTSAGETWNNITTGIKEKWNNLKTNAPTVWENIKTSIRDRWEALKTNAPIAWNNISKTIKDSWKNLKTNVPTAWNDIKKAIADKWREIKEGAPSWGKNLIGGFVQGVKDKAASIKDTLKNVGNTIKNFLGFSSPTKEGPGRDADKWAPSFMDMYRKGISQGIPGIRASVSTIADEMAGLASMTVQPAVRATASVGYTADSGMMSDGIAQAVYRAIIDAFRITQASSGQSGNDDKELVLKIDNTVLARMQLPAIIREGQRQGLNLVVQPQGV